MEIMSDFVWVVEVEEGVHLRFPNGGQLKALLDEQDQLDNGQVFVQKEHGMIRARWWQRVFGSPAYIRDLEFCFMLDWHGPYASLVFLDGAGSEYRALDLKQPVDAPEEIRLQLSGGEPTPAPAKECMQKTRAFAAVREFIDTGMRPEWLSYRYVR